MMIDNTIGIYIHIPFCDKKCYYCDFCSFHSNEMKKHTYVEKLCQEIIAYAADFSDYKVSSVFIGGGTPSVIAPYEMIRIIQTLKNNYSFLNEVEFSCEANPESLNQRFLQAIYSQGVNRLSVGIQSFDDAILRGIGRLHNSERARSVIKEAREVGFSNINVDLMYGLPNQDLFIYENTLEAALELGVEHISAYNLIVEEKTVLYHRVKNDKVILPDEELQLAMYELTKKKLHSNDYIQYEISNYAKSGYECKHNIRYWSRENYLGFGVSAHSLVNEVRFHNDHLLSIYQNHITENRLYSNYQKLAAEESAFEAIMLGLRMMKGIDIDAFYKRYQIDLMEKYDVIITALKKERLLDFNKDGLWLTDEGIKLQNQVLLQFMT